MTVAGPFLGLLYSPVAATTLLQADAAIVRALHGALHLPEQHNSTTDLRHRAAAVPCASRGALRQGWCSALLSQALTMTCLWNAALGLAQAVG